jgi:mannonate dehydratase
MMKITNARVIVCSPGRNFVTLKIETDQGLTGIGDATLNGRELAVAAYLTEHVVPCLIGRDAHQIEDIWQYLYKGAYWRRGPVTMTAIAAVDTALWDLKAKAAGLPLYQLLGGKSRTGVMVYGHANGSDIEHTVDEVLRYADMGYRAIRAQSGVPGLDKVYGVGRGNLFYEPADSDLPSEHDWSTEKYLQHTPRLFERIREKLGFDHHLLHDVHHRLTPIEAGRLGKSLEPYNLFWMEDATPAENQEAFRLIRQHTTTPLAVGEMQGPGAEPADRLHPHDRGARRRHHPPAAHCGPGIAVPGAHRLPRGHRPVARMHGRGAALRPVGAQFRHPGIHAPHR